MRFVKVALIPVLAIVLFALGCGPSSPPETAAVEEVEVKEPTPKPTEKIDEESKPEETAKIEQPVSPKPKPKVEDTTPMVTMETSKGTIKIELDGEKAPETVENFLQYVTEGFYDGMIFHRAIKGFMIQGGGFDANMNEKRTRDTIKNESTNGLKNERGTIAMARRPDPHSASAQFFINHATSPFLDRDQSQDGWGYCVFGRVTEGMDVVDEIAEVSTTTRNGHSDVPEVAVVIKSVTQVE